MSKKLIRSGDKIVRFGRRAPHEKDKIFMGGDMTKAELREHEFTEHEKEKFRRKSFFDKQNLLPYMATPWAGHMLISGATGAGKTWLAKDILKDDKRPVYFVSDIEGRDPSLKKIERQGRLLRLKEPVEGLRNCFVLFDDVRKPHLMDWRDSLYEQGRHNNISVITINHNLRDGQKMKQILSDSKWIALFPQANKTIIKNYLSDRLRLKSRFRNALVNQAEDDGRYLFIHNHGPTFFMTSKSVIPF